jgi:hypothetical protein
MKNYLYFMRLSVAILVAMQLNMVGNCQTLLNENFSYSSGAYLTANGWNAHDAPGTNPVVVNSQGLVFQSYPSSDIGLSALLGNNGEDINRTFTTIVSGTVYCAFLVQVNTIANGYFLHLVGVPVGTNYKGRVIINGTGNSFYFGLSKGSGTTVLTTGSPLSTGVVYLCVLKYSIVDGASNDEVCLYVITGSVPATEPLTPSVGPLADAGQTDLANVSAIALRQYSSSQNILVDGIRVALDWEDAVSALTGNENLLAADNPVLYPVPVSTELIINNTLNVNIIEISDFTGRKIISVKTKANSIIKIPVSQLSPGLYLIKFYTAGGTKTMKFIKS